MASNVKDVGRQAIIVMVSIAAAAQTGTQSILSFVHGQTLDGTVWGLVSLFLGLLGANIEKVKFFIDE